MCEFRWWWCIHRKWSPLIIMNIIEIIVLRFDIGFLKGSLFFLVPELRFSK